MPVNERALRRRAVVAAAALALTGLLGVRAPHAHAAAADVQLPAPTGPYPVGTTARHLVDTSRTDPWHPGRHAHREVMVSLWYPAAREGWRAGGPTAPYMQRRAADHFGRGTPLGAVDWSAVRTHARPDAPVARGSRVRPVLLYSPGLGDPRTWNTSLVEDLASRGYVVVTVDHTYDASEVALPGGRLATSVLPALAARRDVDPAAVLRKAMRARVDDLRFVLDRLGDRRAARLPHALAAAMDLRHVGALGHSAGGFTAVQALYEDRRVDAAVDLDGTLAFPGPGGLSAVARAGVHRPLLLMGTDAADSGPYDHQPSWLALWRHSHGAWKGNATLTGAEHGAYTDATVVLPQLARRGLIPWDTVREAVGTVRPERAVGVTRAYVAAFFDRFLRGGGPLPHFPELRER
ncbi:esterase [Streptomyces sp. NPDC049585]|uniref:alpha/beta hydrolase family protein n=1 Tax=Streptomyces sp. NPDC049585 TaxID=3155154 RepID=UPI003419A289